MTFLLLIKVFYNYEVQSRNLGHIVTVLMVSYYTFNIKLTINFDN